MAVRKLVRWDGFTLSLRLSASGGCGFDDVMVSMEKLWAGLNNDRRFVSRRRRRALKFNEAVMVAGVVVMKDTTINVGLSAKMLDARVS